MLLHVDAKTDPASMMEHAHKFYKLETTVSKRMAYKKEVSCVGVRRPIRSLTSHWWLTGRDSIGRSRAGALFVSCGSVLLFEVC